MKNKLDLTKGWLRKGDSDLSAAELIMTGEGPYDTACFHAQQVIEKYLKAFLAYYEQPIPRTHDLEEIQELCCEIESMPELAALDLETLSDYAIQVRYDFEIWPEQDVAQNAIDVAKQVKVIITTKLPGQKQEGE